MPPAPTPSSSLPLNDSASLRVRLVRLLTRHQLMITSFARAITGDAAQAEDVYQEVAVILAREAASLPQGDDEVAAWLRALTMHQALATAPRGPRLGEDVLALCAGQFEPGPADALAVLREAMASCLGSLPADQRRIIDARYSDGSGSGDPAQRAARRAQAGQAVLKRVRVALQDCVERRLGASTVALVRRADDLISAWLADDLDGDGMRALAEVLRIDPPARARFARFCASEMVLAPATRIADVRPPSTAVRRVAVRSAPPKQPQSRWSWLLPASVALLFAALVLILLLAGSSAP